MADAAGVILSPIFENLLTLVTNEIGMQWGVDEEIHKLTSALRTIQDLLMDAEERQSHERAVKRWLSDIKDIAYRAEDTIEEFAIKRRLKELNKEALCSSPLKKVCILYSPCACFNRFKHLHHTGTRIKKINEELESILKRGSQLNLSRLVCKETTNRSLVVQRPPSGPSMNEPIVYGRDVDKQNILNMLLPSRQTSSGVVEEAIDNLSVIPIVGMGGIGKTTIAQAVYNEIEVPNQFDIKIWVCVSEEFDVRRIIQAVIESATGKRCEVSEMGSLEPQLQQLLCGKKYLLVLDDVWNEDGEKWDRLVAPLRCGAPGSKIIVTARSRQVADAMCIRDPYTIKGLSDDECWSVLQKKAFSDGEAEKFPNLVSIGKEIAKKCKGVPITAKVIGALLFSNREEIHWMHIRDTEILKLPKSEEGILSMMRMSYDNLPPHLKQCFAYCSIYPKDYRIPVEDLIEQWIAHGFIHQSQDEVLEDIGNGYFNDLLWRGFFEYESAVDFDFCEVVYCKMHDLVHDLARSVAGDEYVTLRSESNSINGDFTFPIRHLTLAFVKMGDAIPVAFEKLKYLRTLFIPFYIDSKSMVVVNQMISRLRHLRVIYMPNADGLELQISISKSIHLRFLKIFCVKSLPNSITNLLCLQTLRLKQTHVQLSKDTSRLKMLRHLEFLPNYGSNKACMLPKVGELRCLRTLSEFVVTKDKRCGVDELGGLDIGGKLTISKLENVSDGVAAQQARLIDKHRLQKLDLNWSQTCDTSTTNTEQVLEALQPHQNLRRLLISGYKGNQFSSWLMDSRLSNLVCLQLISCPQCKLPPLSQFPFLEDVSLYDMKAVKHICSKKFPRLKRLTLSHMENLESLIMQTMDGGDLMFPCLDMLDIAMCPKLTSLPALTLPNLRHLRLFHCHVSITASINSLTSLQSLRIQDFKQLVSLPKDMLQNHIFLEKLDIRHCTNLSLADLNIPITLKHLNIRACKTNIDEDKIRHIPHLEIS